MSKQKELTMEQINEAQNYSHIWDKITSRPFTSRELDFARAVASPLLAENERLEYRKQHLQDVLEVTRDQREEMRERAEAAEVRLRELASAEPCAYQWLDTAHLRKHIPQHSHASEWNALIRRPEMPS